MAKREGASARGGVTILCFLAIIAGQLYLLRNVLFSGQSQGLSGFYYIEFVFFVLMIGGMIICWIRPLGWGTGAGKWIAMAVFALYLLFNLLYYNQFIAAYLTGFTPTYQSAAGGIIGIKLVLGLVGVTAGIPVAPPIDKWEYSRRLREKVEMQEAQWAKASVRGARKDLSETVARLKETLSEEELSELLAELQSPQDTPSGNVAEDWRGWGGGV